MKQLQKSEGRIGEPVGQQTLSTECCYGVALLQWGWAIRLGGSATSLVRELETFSGKGLPQLWASGITNEDYQPTNGQPSWNTVLLHNAEMIQRFHGL